MALHTSTILARTPAAILSHLSRLSTTYADHTIIFALNANAPELPTLVSRLTKLTSQTLGCLSAPLPGLASEGIISCSLAVFDKRNTVSFRSTIPGREAPQVGRWHAFRQKNDKSEETLPSGMENELSKSINWDDIWDRSAGGVALPTGLQAVRPYDINSIIYFSDNAPEGLSTSLASLPHATKLGLIASSTPFITGRPVTLFRNENVHSSGAVGIALTSGIPKLSAEFPGIKSITPPLIVTRSEGNLVNELDNGNPSKLLVAAIDKHGIEENGTFKEDGFYLGAFRDNKLSQVYHILSGDPSRGTIALESHAAPTEGTTVQLYHRPKSMSAEVPTRYTQPLPNQRTLAFIASSPDILPEVTRSKEGDSEVIRLLPDTFLASSENGFSLSRSVDGISEGAWRCTVPGALTALEWS